MRPAFVDPRLMGALRSHFPSLCRVQYLTEGVDDDGQVVTAWKDRHADVPCNVTSLKGKEIRGPNQTYAVANFSIALQEYYPDIVESDQAIVGGTTYNILLMDPILDTMTVLSCEVVR